MLRLFVACALLLADSRNTRERCGERSMVVVAVHSNPVFAVEIFFLLCLLATGAHALLQSAANKLFDSIGCGTTQCIRYFITNPNAVVPCSGSEFFRCGRTSSIVAIHIDVLPVRSTGIKVNRVVDFNALADDLGGDLASLGSLALTSAGLDSTLPLAIGRFTALTSLNLTKNDFAGPLPATLTNLKLLRFLDLSHNNFSSSIDSLSSLTALETLHLHENSFGPTIKSAFFTSQFQPTSIKLFNNTFRGAAPLRVTTTGTCEFQFANDRNCFTGCNATTCCQRTCSLFMLVPLPPTPLVFFPPTPLVLTPTPAPTPQPTPLVFMLAPTPLVFLPPSPLAFAPTPFPLAAPIFTSRPPVGPTSSSTSSTSGVANPSTTTTTTESVTTTTESAPSTSTRAPRQPTTSPQPSPSPTGPEETTIPLGTSLKSGVDQQIAIGVGVGGGIALLAGVGLAFWLCRRSNKDEKDDAPTPTSLQPLPAPVPMLIRKTSSRRRSSRRVISEATPQQYGDVPEDHYFAADTVGGSTKYDSATGMPDTKGQYVPIDTATGARSVDDGYAPVPPGTMLRNLEDSSNVYMPLKKKSSRDYVAVPAGALTHSAGNGKGLTKKKSSRRHGSRRNLHASSSSMPRSVETVRDIWQINESDLIIGPQLGKGAFGVVVQADWNGKQVAVKQIRTDAVGGSKAVAEFRNEVKRMAGLPLHKNVVQLFGVSRLGTDLAAVVEFCGKGALSSALYGDSPMRLSAQQLASIALDSARGVRHLHENGVIHRDIAARNVLLDSDLVAKVADFGMSRGFDASVTIDENVTVQDVGPLRWQAPEQMTDRKYSRASDVWSFGVLLFEIFERELPWAGEGNLVVARKVMEGAHLSGGAATPAHIARLMTQCFARTAAERPTMGDVCKTIESSN